MTYDPRKTLELIRGGLLEPAATWRSYLAAEPTWQRTAIELTAPLVVVAVVIGWLLAALTNGILPMGYGHGLGGALVVALLGAAINVAIMSAVASAFAGVFDGRSSFDRAFAGVSLAYIPGWAGVALSGLPAIGWLLQLAGTIAGLVFLYRMFPLALHIPDHRRVLHFVATVVTAMVLNVILGALLGAGTMPAGG